MNELLQSYDLSEPKELAQAVAALLDAKKGRDIVLIDLGEKTVIADYFVIAGATSATAVKALADYVDEEMDRVGVHCLHKDADQKWVAMDYGSVIVHIFFTELREFYQIERLWSDGDNVKKFD